MRYWVQLATPALAGWLAIVAGNATNPNHLTPSSRPGRSRSGFSYPTGRRNSK
jgi:hypothetical protein